MRKTVFFYIVAFIPLHVFAQGPDLPFQVIVADKASVYGRELRSFDFVDDVSTIKIEEGGYLSMVHQSGYTFELYETVFTFDLTPKEHPLVEKPNLGVLDSVASQVRLGVELELTYPRVTSNNVLEWDSEDPVTVYWGTQQEIPGTFTVSIFDDQTEKIQDFKTKKSNYTLKPSTYGLQTPAMKFIVTHTLGDETIRSPLYTVNLISAAPKEKKVPDLLLRTIAYDYVAEVAYEIWQQILDSPQARHYRKFYENFLKRNQLALEQKGISLN